MNRIIDALAADPNISPAMRAALKAREKPEAVSPFDVANLISNRPRGITSVSVGDRVRIRPLGGGALHEITVEGTDHEECGGRLTGVIHYTDTLGRSRWAYVDQIEGWEGER